MIPSMTDPDIDEVLQIREELGAEFDHSPAKMVAYFMQVERQDPNQARYRQTPERNADQPLLIAPATG